MFRPVFDPLADVAQVILLDHRGNGRSEFGDPWDWTLVRWGGDVRGFCDALGIEKPVVPGYSFGGFVAQSYAARHPGHAGKLVLYSTAPVLEDGPQLDMFEALGGARARDAAAAHFAAPTKETMAAFRSICFPLYNVKPADPDGKRRMMLNDAVSVAFFQREAPRMDFRPLPGRIECPVLVVAGDRDPRCPLVFSQMLMAGIRPGLARLAVMEGCGHGPHIEEPERVRAVPRAFIEG